MSQIDMWEIENRHFEQGIVTICGVDEAGRGPLAGPVCAAAVILPPNLEIPGLTDSKKLSDKRRRELYPVIMEQAIAYGIGLASHEEIDEINILQATFLAMERFLKIKCADRLGLKNFDSARPYYMQFTMKVSADDFFRILKEEAEMPLDPMELVYPKELPLFDKYDEYLPEELVRKGFAFGVLDVETMRKTILDWNT